MTKIERPNQRMKEENEMKPSVKYNVSAQQMENVFLSRKNVTNQIQNVRDQNSN